MGLFLLTNRGRRTHTLTRSHKKHADKSFDGGKKENCEKNRLEFHIFTIKWLLGPQAAHNDNIFLEIKMILSFELLIVG